MSRRRYIVVYGALFIAAVLFSALYGVSSDRNVITCLAVAAAVLLCASAALLYKFSRRKMYIRVLGFTVLAGFIAVSGVLYTAVYDRMMFAELREFAGKNVTAYGIVRSEPNETSTGKNISFKVDLSYIEADGDAVRNKGKMMVYINVGSEDISKIKYGTGIKFDAFTRLPTEYIENFAYRRNLLSSGCSLTCFVKGVETYTPKRTISGTVLALGHAAREKITDYAEAVIPPGDLQALFKGILLGMKDDFSDILYNNMAGAGFMHIAAVSGLHVMFLCTVINTIFFFVPMLKREYIILPLLFIFLCIAAFTPSVSRAVIMMSFMLVSKLLLKDSDAVTSLFSAALILILQNPYVLFSASFLMSFSATLSLLIYYKPMAGILNVLSRKISRGNKRVYKNTNRIFDFFAVPLACQILLIPISVYFFGYISWGSIIGNIIVIPCTILVFCGGYVNFVVYLIFPNVARLFAMVLCFPLGIICVTAEKLSNAGIELDMQNRPGIAAFAAYLLFCVALYYVLARSADRLSAVKQQKKPLQS